MDPLEIPYLRPAVLKIQRAQHHILDAAKRIVAFENERPLQLVKKHNPKGRKLTVRAEAEKPIPEEFSLIIGDAIHNLCAALDHTMFAILSDMPGINVRHIAFPFASGAKDLERTINERQIHLAGEKVVKAISSIKPYAGGNDRLYGMHRLDIRDKHRQIVLTASQIHMTAHEIGRLHPEVSVPLLGTEPFIFTNPKDPELIAITEVIGYGNRKQRRAMGSRTFEEKTSFRPSIGIVFGEGQPFEGELVIPALRDMYLATKAAVANVVEATIPD
jgi:hypothetical protein